MHGASPDFEATMNEDCYEWQALKKFLCMLRVRCVILAREGIVVIPRWA